MDAPANAGRPLLAYGECQLPRGPSPRNHVAPRPRRTLRGAAIVLPDARRSAKSSGIPRLEPAGANEPFAYGDQSRHDLGPAASGERERHLGRACTARRRLPTAHVLTDSGASRPSSSRRSHIVRSLKAWGARQRGDASPYRRSRRRAAFRDRDLGAPEDRAGTVSR